MKIVTCSSYMKGLSSFTWSCLMFDLKKKIGYVDMSDSNIVLIFNDKDEVLAGMSIMRYWGGLSVDRVFVLKDDTKLYETLVVELFNQASLLGCSFIFSSFYSKDNCIAFLLDYGFKIDFANKINDSLVRNLIICRDFDAKKYNTFYKIKYFEDSYEVYMKYFVDKDKLIEEKVNSIAIKNNDNYIGGAIVTTKLGVANIDALAVLDGYQGKKIGSALMSQVNKLCISNNINVQSLQTLSCQAVPFYEKMGFTAVYNRQGYLNNLSQYFMMKRLNL